VDERVRASIDHLWEGVQVIDRDWRYLYLNRTAAAHGRRTPDELIGRTMMEAYPGIEHSDLFRTLSRVMETGARETLRNLFTFPTGEQRWFDLLIDPVPDGLCVLSLDVTDRVAAEGELQRLNEEIQQQRLRVFRATMTTVHDIVNNFLNNLQVVQIEAEGKLPPEVLTLLERLIHDAAAELRQLSDLETINEKQMAIGEGIDFPGVNERR
jgi:PAS domain S-box-containing protein